MRVCPNCGTDLTEAKKLVRTSARDLVEGLTAHDPLILAWCTLNVPNDVNVSAEMDMFKDRMRANGYKVGANLVKDARAAFRTHMRNAVKFAQKRPVATTVPRVAERKEL